MNGDTKLVRLTLQRSLSILMQIEGLLILARLFGSALIGHRSHPLLCESRWTRADSSVLQTQIAPGDALTARHSVHVANRATFDE
jgi:hypothetical protein